MKPSTRRPRITFDTNVVGVRTTRAFWGTLCEGVGQKVVLTPTAASETLRRVRLEGQYEWARKLKDINDAVRKHGRSHAAREEETIDRIGTNAAKRQTPALAPYLEQTGLSCRGSRPNGQIS